ncbi:MAG TPA: hypothetical protein VG992_03365 [Candidatus Saccharimonadales bacterium]|nr:hypothetical protein [Candidatus Saccharimonadales bacterium]
MLKRLIRHRLFVVLIMLMVAAFIFLVPLKHDYSTQLVHPSDCSHGCAVSIEAQVTEVHYGVPWGWLTIGQQTDANGKIIRNYTTKSTKRIVFDTLTLLLSLAIILPMTKQVNHSLDIKL